MAVVQASLPDAVSWEELLEQTGRDPQLIELKSAIARGYLNTRTKSSGSTVRPSLHRVSRSRGTGGERSPHSGTQRTKR